jgi:hypothetical protein
MDRFCQRFGLRRVSWVGGFGLMEPRELDRLEDEHVPYFAGAAVREHEELRVGLLSRAGRFTSAGGELAVKEVWLEGRRYVVLRDEGQAAGDAAAREALVQALREQLLQDHLLADPELACWPFVGVEPSTLVVADDKVREDARFDGLFFVRTNTTLPADEVAAQYVRLRQLEDFLGAARPPQPGNFHWRRSEAVGRGEAVCTFLAWLLVSDLQRRLRAAGSGCDWWAVRQELQALAELEVRTGDTRHRLHTQPAGLAAAALAALGIAWPPEPDWRPLPTQGG